MIRGFGVVTLVAACNFSHGAGPGDATPAGDAAAPRDASVAPDGARDAAAPRDAPPVEVQLLQQITAYAPNGSPLNATLPATPQPGDVLVMVGAANHGTLAGVSGGGVATWTRAAYSPTNANIEIWFGVTDGSSATVTITFPNNPLSIWMVVSEWSGLTGALDAAHATAGKTSPASAGAITTGARDLIIFGVADSAPNMFGAPSGGAWSALDGITSAPIVQAEWYGELDPTSGYAPQVSETAHAWDAAIAALEIDP